MNRKNKQTLQHKKLYVILSTLLFLLLTGCSSSPQYFERVTEVSKNDYFANIEVEKIKKYDVHVAHNDQFIAIYIPEAKLFFENSTNLTPEGRKILNEVIKIVSLYEVDTITVKNYDYAVNNTQLNKTKLNALTKTRALKIEQYLWSQNIDASVIYSSSKLLEQSIANKNNDSGVVIGFIKQTRY